MRMFISLKGLGSMRKKKGAQSNPVQAIGGAKSGNPYSGDPVAGVKRKRIASSHVHGSKNFLK